MSEACTHVAISYSADSISIYFNGTKQPTQFLSGGAYCGSLVNSSDELLIGAYSNFSNDIVLHYEGMIDELRIWSKVLTELEVQQYMNLQPVGNEINLVLYYSFDNVTAGNNQTVSNIATTAGALDGITSSSSASTPNNVPFACILGLNNELDAEFELLVYPNPSTDVINFEFLSEEVNENLELKIYDGLGRVVYTGMITSPFHSVSSSNFESGNYNYSIKSSNGNYSTIGKIVILRNY
jgi:hypothetical protein